MRIFIANRGEIAAADHPHRAAARPRDCRGLRRSRSGRALRPAGHHSLPGSAPPTSPSPTCRQRRCWRPPNGPGASAVHPGYGFLSERADAAPCLLRRGAHAGSGPGPSVIERMGSKIQARRLASQTGALDHPWIRRVAGRRDPCDALLAHGISGADQGLCRRRRKRDPCCEVCRRFPRALERGAAGGCPRFRRRRGDRRALHPRPRHIEVQVVGDRFGNVARPRHPRMFRAAPLPEVARGGARAEP